MRRIAFWNILLKDIRSYYLKPPNISWGMDAPVLAEVLATSSAEPGMFSERMSASSMLIMTTIHRVESRTLVSRSFVGGVLIFTFSLLCASGGRVSQRASAKAGF